MFGRLLWHIVHVTLLLASTLRGSLLGLSGLEKSFGRRSRLGNNQPLLGPQDLIDPIIPEVSKVAFFP